MEHGGIVLLTDAELNEYRISIFDKEISIRKRFKNSGGNTKVKIHVIVSSLNHLFESIRKYETPQDYFYLANKLITLNNRLTPKMLEVAVVEGLANGIDGSTMKRDTFLKVMKEELIDDEIIPTLILKYCLRHVSPIGLEESNWKGVKFAEKDIHITHVISVYIKLLNVFYYTISDTYKFDEVTRKFLVPVIEKIEPMVMYLHKGPTYKSYVDTLYDYMSHYNNHYIDREQILMDKFTILGTTRNGIHQHAIHAIISSLKSYSILHYSTEIPVSKKTEDDEDDDDEPTGEVILEPKLKLDKDKTIIFKVGDNVDDFKFYPLNTSKYIKNSGDNASTRQLAQANPAYSIQYLTETDNPDGLSDVAKYEIQLEKNNKEQYNDMLEMREHIKNEVKDEIWKDYEYLYQKMMFDKTMDGIGKNVKTFKLTILSKFFIYRFLEENFDSGDVFNFLLREHQILIIIACYHRLKDRYPTLAKALLSTLTSGKKTRASIAEDELTINLQMMQVNQKKTLSEINDIIKSIYVYNEDGELTTLNIKDEFLSFINRNEEI